MASVRRALVTSIGVMLLRRRLQRQSGPGAAIALVGLQLLGPRILKVRLLLAWALALTIVGGIAVVAIWWWRRRNRPEAASEPAAAPEPADQAPAGPNDVSPPPDWAPAAA